MQNVPQIISFSKFLDARGNLFSIEFLSIPFSPKRLFFTNVNNELIKRGGHLHLTCHQLLFSLRGNITVNTIFEKKEQNYLIFTNSRQTNINALTLLGSSAKYGLTYDENGFTDINGKIDALYVTYPLPTSSIRAERKLKKCSISRQGVL